MFRHILVPLDGSLHAESALPVAARIARASAGMLILLRTISAVSENEQNAGTSWSSFLQGKLQSEQEEAQQYLARIASSASLAGLALSVVVPRGPIAAAIQTAVQSYQVDLLICREQPACPGSRQEPFGPFADQISRSLTIPVLLLPEQEPLHDPLAEAGKTIDCLVAFTGPQPESALIPPASALVCALAGRRPGNLHFMPFSALHAQKADGFPVATKRPDPRMAAHSQQPVPRRSAVLLREEQTKQAAAEEPEHCRIVVLRIPLPQADDNALEEVAVHPRLLVPLNTHLSHA